MSVFFRVDQWQKFHRFLLFALCSFTTSLLQAAPRIECEHPKFDFGTVIGQEQITHEFVIWNRGDEPLMISKIKNCCGVETEVEPMTIPPGSNAVCTSVFTTKNRYGTQDKQILLITNDKKNLYYDLRMVGTLLKPVEFEPRFVRLSNLIPDSAISEIITATNLLEQSITLDSVSTTIEGLETKVVESGDRNWTVQVSSATALSVGRINGKVQLHFSTGIVDVPVIGTVDPVIQATPNKIQIASSASGTVDRLVMLRSGVGRAFEITSAKLENADGQVEFKKLADGKWQLKLKIQPSTIKPDASIVIKTSIEAQEAITIQLR
ncbi:MAG: DUF1573 domain-containing protein [Pontiellaceae bacterium]|nr:DUF1573 domain-containing protein [Pontiellaceae bacterium]